MEEGIVKTLNLKAPSFKTIAICALQAILLAGFVYISVLFCGTDELFIGFSEGASNVLRQSWVMLIFLFALPIAGKLAAESTDNPELIYNPLLRWPMRIGGVMMSIVFLFALKIRCLPFLEQVNNQNLAICAIAAVPVVIYLLYRTVREYVEDYKLFRNKPVLDAFFNWTFPFFCSAAIALGFILSMLIIGAFIIYILAAVVRRY